MPEPGDVIHGVICGQPMWAVCVRELSSGHRISDIHMFPGWDTPCSNNSTILDREVVRMDDPEAGPRANRFRNWIEQMLMEQAAQLVSDAQLPTVDPVVFGHSYTTQAPQPYQMFMHPAAYTQLVDAGFIDNAEATEQVTDQELENRVLFTSDDMEVTTRVVPAEEVYARDEALNAAMDAADLALALQVANRNSPVRANPPRRRRIRRPRRRG